MSHLFSTLVEVSLDSLEANFKLIKQHVGQGVKIIAIVKANAYGHGLAEIAKALSRFGCDYLAVNRLSEAIDLRKSGIDCPILVTGHSEPCLAENIVRYRVTSTVTDIELAYAISKTAINAGQISKIHIKVDSGMNRYGVYPNDVLPLVNALQKMQNLEIEGVFSHFASADSLDMSLALKQLDVFCDVCEAIGAIQPNVSMYHIANSAAIMNMPASYSGRYLNTVRPGLALYGMNPLNIYNPMLDLQPILSLKSYVSGIKTILPGMGIGYNHTFIATQETKVALIPIGYGDGYHRIMSNKGHVLINGQRADILGIISMDQLSVNVSCITGVKKNDEVIIIGKQNEESITAEEIAKWAETINYEITTSIAHRVERIYLGRV